NSLFSYFDLINNTLLCCGYFASIVSINNPASLSFSNNGAGGGNSDLYLVGIRFIIASNVPSLLIDTFSILEALLCNPCNCFLLRLPLCWYCLYRLIMNEETG